MKNQRSKKVTEKELAEKAYKLIWEDGEVEEAIKLIKRLLKLKPRYPLYYLLLCDCYSGIAKRDNDFMASEKAQKYYSKAFAQDTRFICSDYFQQGIEEAAQYLLKTQDLAASIAIENSNLEKLSTKQVTFNEFFDAKIGQIWISEDPSIRLAYFKYRLMNAKAGRNQKLFFYDSEGKLIRGTFENLLEAKLKDPKHEITVTLEYEDPITEEVTKYEFEVLKNIPLEPPSEKVLKARQYRKKYYYKEIDGIKINQEKAKKHQKKNDRKDRQRKRVRNKLDYSLRKSGVTHYHSPHEDRKP
ncbi:MAG: hypothetical protein ACFFG0_22225 [Candidatus Thorarchaeota archaeon]